MNDRDARAADIFSDALELSPGARAAFVAAACGDDEPLRKDVQALLAAAPAADALFARPVSLATPLEESDPAVGLVLGAWRILAPLAHGGMGSVYRGERIDAAFAKTVAIKLLRVGLAGDTPRDRFHRERQVLARLEHPHIARLLDGGSTADGVPYLVMEFVDGMALDAWCDTRALDMRARLALFLDVCDAVAYAHRALVVHRDLKPANIFVDGDGRVKLLDFGIAKLLDEGEDGVDLTRTATRAFSPRYASPEQIAGAPITTASDVYSLGVVLFELLAGVSPYAEARERGAIERAAVAGETVSLTRAIASADDRARLRGTSAARLARACRGDLETIVQRAMAREPERRYGSVQELADDLRRFLAGEPVRARPDTVAYRATRFARRNRGVVAGVVTAVAALAVALVVSLGALRDARRNAREAEWLAYSGAVAAAEAAIHGNQLGEAARRLAQAPVALRGWEWRHLVARLDRSRAHWRAHGLGITRLRYSHDGRVLATSSMDGSVRLWDATRGDSLAAWMALGSEAESVVPFPDGTRWAIGLQDGRVLLATRGEAAPRAFASGPGWALVDISPDGTQLVAGFADGSAAVYDVATGATLTQWQAHEMFALPVWSPRGDRLATGGGDARLRVWDTRGHVLRDVAAHARRVYALAWSADGVQLVTGSMDRTATVWDAETLTPRATFAEHAGTVASVAFSADGTRVLSCGADGRVFVWDAATHAALAELRGHRGDPSAAARDPRGGGWATGDWGGEVRLWDAEAADVRSLALPSESDMLNAALDARFTTDGTRLVALTTSGHVLEWHGVARSRPAREYRARGRHVVWLDDRTALAATATGMWVRWRDGVADSLPGVPGDITALDAHAAGRLAATGGTDSTVRLWRAGDLAPLAVLGRHAGEVRDVAFSPDGRWLASCGRDSVVCVWDVAARRLVHTWHGHRGAVLDVAFSPDGARLASASRDGTVRLWDVARGESLATLCDLGTPVGAVAFSPDGLRLAAGAQDQTVRFFDLAARRELLALHGHTGQILALAFAPDGRTLASASLDGSLRLWEAPARIAAPR